LQDKWRLVPECLQLRSLLKQHIQSYDHFVSTELRQIVVNTPANSTIKSDCDPKFFLSYRDVWVGSSPSVDEDSFYTTLLTPQLCRWRDLTYSSPLYATIRYTRGNHVVEKRGVLIGRIPVMVRSRYCALSTTTPRAAQQQQQQHQQHPNGSERNPPLMSMSTIPKRSGGIMSESDRMEGLKECPYDPGGYFIVKGVEKAILIQEQLSKNRVIIETTASSSDGGATVGDGASNVGPGASSSSGGAVITASITSSTHERKSKSYLIWKHGRVYLKNNTLGEDVPVVIVLKALGMQSDYELVSWVAGSTTTTTTPSSSTSTLRSDEGQDEEQDAEEEECDSSQLVSALALSLEDAQRHSIYTQHQALRFIGNRVRGGGRGSGYSGTNPSPATGPGASAAAAAQQQQPSAAASFTSPRRQPSPEEEARDVLAHVVLSHVPVVNYDFRAKAIYVCNIVRRLLLVHLGHVNVDDKDYYGNKRLELAGNLLSLLFEDLFKLFNKDLKRQADLVLSKPNRAMAFDVIKTIRPDTITNGMVNAIATGNWVLKRFRMDRAGVTQVVSRLSYLSALGMMTRINSQFEKTRKVSGPRSLQPSQWGMLCPADTPEGAWCEDKRASATKDDPWVLCEPLTKAGILCPLTPLVSLCTLACFFQAKRADW
jgi:DNA-directed RNA polymerase III subunit RPC2